MDVQSRRYVGSRNRSSGASLNRASGRNGAKAVART
jgi:hypothetical protein